MIASTLCAGLMSLCAAAPGQTASGEVVGSQKISALQGGLPPGISTPGSTFGQGVAVLGDIDGDGTIEVAVSELSPSSGVVWILSLASDGTVAAAHAIAEGVGGFQGDLSPGDLFGLGLAAIGDLDGNGVVDLAVGAPGDDSGGSFPDVGAVWILFLDATGQVLNAVKWGAPVGDGFVPGVYADDNFGLSMANLGDLNGDGLCELAVGAFNDGITGDGLGSARVFFMQSDGYFSNVSLITNGFGGFGNHLQDNDHFSQVGALGDFNGDGIPDLMVGSPYDDDGEATSQFAGPGAVWLLMLDAAGAVTSHFKISDTAGEFASPLGANDRWGMSATAVGDLDGNGVIDLAVGSQNDLFSPTNAGAVWILFMESDGTVRSHSKVGAQQGGFTGLLKAGDSFGSSVASLGDLNGDGVIDLLVAATGDDDADSGSSFTNSGAVWVLFLNDGYVPWDATGAGVPGTAGTPELWGTGSLQPGPYAVHLADALPNGAVYFVIGLTSLNLPFKNGLLVPNPDIILGGLQADGNGELTLGGVWPAGIPAGVTAFTQFWVADPAASVGFASTNGLGLTTP